MQGATILDPISDVSRRAELVHGPATDALPSAEPVHETSYENCVPDFVERELLRLYQNLYSTLAQLKVYGSLPGHTSTYVLRRGSRIVSVLLFVMQDGQARVLNELILMTRAEIERFSTHVFTEYKNIGVVCFRAIQVDAPRGSLAHGSILRQYSPYASHTVLALPAERQQFIDAFDGSAQMLIRSCMRRLRGRHPSFQFEAVDPERCSAEQLQKLVALKHAQRRQKGDPAGTAKRLPWRRNRAIQVEAERLRELLTAGGLIGMALIDGRICGGIVCCRTGSNYFVQVLAAEHGFDTYRLDLLCAFGMACECIARGARELHFGWGQAGCKAMLAKTGVASTRELLHVDVYRSGPKLLRHLRLAAAAGTVRRARQRMDAQERFVGEELVELPGCSIHGPGSGRASPDAAVDRDCGDKDFGMEQGCR